MISFTWHGDDIARSTAVDATYKNTQNVRRFLSRECVPESKFDRELMSWIANGEPKTMGDVADERLQRQHPATNG